MGVKNHNSIFTNLKLKFSFAFKINVGNKVIYCLQTPKILLNISKYQSVSIL